MKGTENKWILIKGRGHLGWQNSGLVEILEWPVGRKRDGWTDRHDFWEVLGAQRMKGWWGKNITGQSGHWKLA